MRFPLSCLALLALLPALASGRAADSPPGPAWINPWRTGDGGLAAGTAAGGGEPREVDGPGPVNPWRREGGDGPEGGVDLAALPPPRNEYNTLAGGNPRAMNDRGIDTADTKWRRQARITGVRLRMLNGPEAGYSREGFLTNLEEGARHALGATAPVNVRWEMAALNTLSSYRLRESGARAGLDSLTLRLGGNPSVSKRPWFSITPFAGLGDADGRGLGVSAGYSWSFSGGIGLDAEAYYSDPWDEGYDTAVQDGRRHGFALGLTVPVDRRLSLAAGVDGEWLELGPRAAAGKQSAGRRWSWNFRANYAIWRRDGAFMDYGFRNPTLWSEDLVPTELGIFGDLLWSRYLAPENFTVLAPTRKSFRQRIGVFYNQALSPRLGFNSEAYVGQDPRRGIGPGEIHGVTGRLILAVNSRLRLWAGLGYESDRQETTAAGTGGGTPTRNLSLGLNCNF
jgi:hypothetical protein